MIQILRGKKYRTYNLDCITKSLMMVSEQLLAYIWVINLISNNNSSTKIP